MATRNYWVVDDEEVKEEHIISGVDELEPFSFHITRLKDIYTSMEVLKITAYYEDANYGTVVSKISKLDTLISELKDIGINLSRNSFVELISTINNNYYKLVPVERESIENNIPDSVVDGIVDYFRQYIEESNIKINNNYYDIPTEDFKKAYSESVFRRFNIADMKEALKIRNYTRCNTKRTDYSIKTDGVNHRYISFCADIIDKKE